MNNVRTVSDTKRAFYSAFARPVTSVYRRVVEELMVELHLLVVNADFRYDPVFALGTVTAFDTFMQGYRPEADRERIFTALTQAIGFDPSQLRRDAEGLLALTQDQGADVLALLSQLSLSHDRLTDLHHLLQGIADNPKFRYSRLFAIGLFTLLGAVAPEQMADDSQRKALIAQVGNALHLNDGKLEKDLDLYRSNQEKVAQAQQVMADMLQAERKKREQRAAASQEKPSETASP